MFWCTADVGWITGHSYLVYGPLANGAKTILFEGVPNYPTTARMSEVVDKHKVNILYTAPTAIRALMAKGDEAIKGTSRDSLRIMGSVVNRLTQKRGSGTTARSVTKNHRLWILGGKPKPAVS